MRWNYFAFGHDFDKILQPAKRKDVIDAICCGGFRIKLDFLAGRREWHKSINAHRLLNCCNKSNCLTVINALVEEELKSACVETYLLCAKKCVIDYADEVVVFSIFAY